jgi:hypothetical protein
MRLWRRTPAAVFHAYTCRGADRFECHLDLSGVTGPESGVAPSDQPAAFAVGPGRLECQRARAARCEAKEGAVGPPDAAIYSLKSANASSGEQGTRSATTARDVMALSSGLAESASGAAAVSTGGERRATAGDQQGERGDVGGKRKGRLHDGSPNAAFSLCRMKQTAPQMAG